MVGPSHVAGQNFMATSPRYFFLDLRCWKGALAM